MGSDFDFCNASQPASNDFEHLWDFHGGQANGAEARTTSLVARAAGYGLPNDEIVFPERPVLHRITRSVEAYNGDAKRAGDMKGARIPADEESRSTVVRDQLTQLGRRRHQGGTSGARDHTPSKSIFARPPTHKTGQIE